MPNTGFVTKRELTYIDTIVYDTKVAPLRARQLFTSKQIPRDREFYKFKVRKGVGEAKKYTNRMTDIPGVDEEISEYTVPLTESILSANYTKKEVEAAAAGDIDLLADQAILVNRGLAEREDKIIFNGLKSDGIVGITCTDTDKTGFQQINAQQTFKELTTDTEEGAIKLRNFFKDAVSKITNLIGYEGAKPTLLLPQAEIDELDKPFNKYNPGVTVRSLIEPWLDSIVAVPKLEGKYWHPFNASATAKAKDMGILCLRDKEVAQIPDAYPIERQPEEYHNMVTTIPYMQKHGGLAVRYPSAFVQLLNIN